MEEWTCCGGPCDHHSKARQEIDKAVTAYLTEFPETATAFHTFLSIATQSRFTDWKQLDRVITEEA